MSTNIQSIRNDKIEAIIKDRRPLVTRLEKVQENLRRLSFNLGELENKRNVIIKIAPDEIHQNLQEIDFSTVRKKIGEELEILEKLKRRFARDTLNIGVVGRARQGKSRLLQSVSGLATTEIPDGDRQHCTGVRSTILHKANISEPYADVWFYSESSFLNEVIMPYFRELRLSPFPYSMEDFVSESLPALPENLSGYAEPLAKYEHLRRYHQHFEKYKDLLHAESPKKIPHRKIQEYVAQVSHDGENKFYNYLAVREVKIVCNFPHTDVGQIALIDMPGLGDTGIGDQERMVKVLGDDVDMVIFVRMPKALGDYWADVDVQLYDLARSALIELPINQWSFMVLNHTKQHSNNGDNEKNCKDLRETIHEKHLDVVQCITADCSDKEHIRGDLLDNILTYLAENITKLDQQYASSCLNRLLTIQSEADVELRRAQHAIGQGETQSKEFALFGKLFNQLWDDLTTGLETLLRELRDQRNEQNFLLTSQLVAAIKACREDTALPNSLDEINVHRDREGAYDIAYHSYLHEVRTHLSQHFLSLDDALKQFIDEVKAQIAEIFVEQGKLGYWIEERESQFLHKLAATIPEDFDKLHRAFQILVNFNLAYREFIQYRIRQSLDRLTPDLTPLKLTQEPSAKQISEYLTTLHAETVYELESMYVDWLTDPNKVAFAVVEEFVDQILRAKEIEEDWRTFYYEVRAEVWQSDFEAFGERSRMRQEWTQVVEKTLETNQVKNFQFFQEIR